MPQLDYLLVGIIVTATLFIVNYSARIFIRPRLSGGNFHSRVDRPLGHGRVLNDKGQQICILTLQEYIFFGASNILLEEVRNIISVADSTISFITSARAAMQLELENGEVLRLRTIGLDLL